MLVVADVAVRMAIHRNAHLLESAVNLESIVSRVRERRVFPASATPYLQQLAVPDNGGRQNRNLMIWLEYCSPEQFEVFMTILEEDGERDNRGHKDLVEALREEYKRIRENPGTVELIHLCTVLGFVLVEEYTRRVTFCPWGGKNRNFGGYANTDWLNQV